ncbi:Csu type fimbrial protein [Acinetobacter tibetensis]|uniref:Spore coat U domain-containing protein n=1 Tax=Acinetobacter tibetensis TaxID=2943497 RepID=A0AAE9LTK9_9GAMM|nr:spore coat U domain-containing protein [Acinetobacter tibetensis]USE84557.1 spore coat U domain-containing protein [Acinetobacter tibetensis]
MKLYYSAFFACTLAAASVYIYAAQQDSTSFNVSITIKEMCNIKTANGTNLDFGTVNRTSKPNMQSTQLAVTCTQGTPYNIALQSQRKMTSKEVNNMSIPYNLYQDANRTTLWGAETQNAYRNIGTGRTQTLPVWGTINQSDTDVPAGVYSDKVTAVITY